jgi:hypothetical protein
MRFFAVGKARGEVWGEAYYVYVEPQTLRIIPPTAKPSGKKTITDNSLI